MKHMLTLWILLGAPVLLWGWIDQTWAVTDRVSNAYDDIGVKSVDSNASWAIVGAGPAGIAVIGILLDLGIAPETIHWIDPEFNVGRLGKYYTHVPGNGKTEAYIQFLDACRSFKECDTQAVRDLRSNNPEDRCTLLLVINALQDITRYLSTKIVIHKTIINAMQRNGDLWNIGLESGESFSTHNVVLATGSHPVSLNYPVKEEIPLDLALDNKTLQTIVSSNDTVAVIGGSHSAVLILKYLYEGGIKRIINFFKHPIVYSYDLGEGNATGFNGLKGAVAQWAYSVLEKQKPPSILRLHNTQEARDAWLPLCSKIIYAIGYERNDLPFLDAMESVTDSYDGTTGVIAPRLFGIGIAFPEQKISEEAKVQNLIGIIDFMTYAQRVVPAWIKLRNGYQHLHKFDELFKICVL